MLRILLKGMNRQREASSKVEVYSFVMDKELHESTTLITTRSRYC